jgi:hypothetical protein
VHRFEAQRFQDQEVKRALDDIGVQLSHGRKSGISSS